MATGSAIGQIRIVEDRARYYSTKGAGVDCWQKGRRFLRDLSLLAREVCVAPGDHQRYRQPLLVERAIVAGTVGGSIVSRSISAVVSRGVTTTIVCRGISAV